MSSWPLEIANDEAIVRGICSPYHVKKGKLQPQAYRPPAGREDVSVMRHDWIGADRCKSHAKRLEELDAQPQKVYEGLAVLSAEQIRRSGAKLIDSRDQFEGHADILHGIILPRGDPPSAPEIYKLRERLKALAKEANYFPDPIPECEPWSGPNLDYRR